MQTRTAGGGESYAYVDLLGRKTAMTDPDMGAWSYEYNAFGELIRQTNAKGEATRVGYDVLGRMVRRLDLRDDGSTEADAAWIYDSAPGSGLGQLYIEDIQENGATPLRRTHTCDGFGRLARPRQAVPARLAGRSR